MKAAAEILFNGSYPTSLTYDKTKVSILTRRLKQTSLSASASDKFVSPQLPAIARVQEQSAVSVMMPYVWAYSPTIDYIFLADNSAAGATRIIACYSWDKVNHIYTYLGKTTVTFPNATNFTVRGQRALNRRYNTGTITALSTLQTAAIPWTRSGTVATVTTGGAHGYTTGQSLRITVTSDVTAIVLGTVTLTVTSSNTYTFACLNAGSASGTITVGLQVASVEAAVTWTRSTTVATVAHTAHPYITGQTIRVLITSDAAAIILGTVVVTVTGVNAYTFTCLNAGGASGTLTVCPVGTVVTGSGSAWATNRLQSGARIGFGSNDYTVIGAWYEIQPTFQIQSDTSILLTTDIPPIAATTAYVIEETMLVLAMTNATATNGGLFVVKGVNIGLFTAVGTSVAAATTYDNVRASYWLKDAATVTNVTAAGVTVEFASDTGLACSAYVMDGAATTLKIFKYDLRKLLTLAAGADNSTLILATGNFTTTGNISQNNNGRISTLNHGPGSGVPCLYMITATRVYRIVLTAITAASTTFPADFMTETPPGTASSFALTAGFNAIAISDATDRIIILTNTPRGYVTQYRTDAGQFDNIFGIDSRQLDQSTEDAGLVPGYSAGASAPVNTVFAESGFMHVIRNTTSITTNIMYCVPVAADWQYASINSDRVITPEIQMGTTKKLYRVLVNEVRRIGSIALCMEAMAYRVYYRTSGITDNSGSWTLLTDDCDLSGIGAPSSIQFMFEFKILGYLMNPARLIGLAVLYETDDSLPPELRWSVQDSDNTSGTVGVVQDAVFTSLVTLTINYYRADNDVLVLTQSSASTTNGVWEFWNGSAWAAGLSTNTINVRRRFRPTAGLPTGVDVYAKVSSP